MEKSSRKIKERERIDRDEREQIEITLTHDVEVHATFE